jgi:hypothetical protein
MVASVRRELEDRERLVEDLALKLQEARDSLRDFKTELSSSLGLSVANRRSRVMDLIRQGKTLKATSDILGVAVATVKSDLWKCERDGLYPVPLASEDDEASRRRNHVARLWKYDSRVHSEADVASRLGIPVEQAEADVEWLEENGYIEVDHSEDDAGEVVKDASGFSEPPVEPVGGGSTAAASEPLLPEASEGLAPVKRGRKSSGASPSETCGGEADGGEGDDCGAATTEELRLTVSRLLRGERARLVLLLTTRKRDHSHVVEVDGFGDGRTVADESGHTHKVATFLVGNAHGHFHELTISSPP